MSEFQRVFSKSPWEKKIGFCRSLRVGSQIFVSGTAPVADGGGTYAPNDAYRQTKRCLELIERAVKEHGASLRHVVRTRIFVTDICRLEEYARAHCEVFADFLPASSILEIKGLVASDMLVEIEADLVL